jgi:hypothetical protein
MTEFNLEAELAAIPTTDNVSIQDVYKVETMKLDELDASVYELGVPAGIYSSSGVRDPESIGKNEQKDILESIFQGIEEKTFNKLNSLTGQFIYLHGKGLLGSLGGIIDLVIGVLDTLGLTDDLINGIMGFAGGAGSALEAGIEAVLGQVFGNGRVNDAIQKGGERSNKFSEDTSKRITQIQKEELDLINHANGHKKLVNSGVYSVLTGKTIHKSSFSTNFEAPLFSISSDTAVATAKTYKLVSDLFSTQTQHADFTIDDSFTINANVISSTSNNHRIVSQTSVFNSNESEFIGMKSLHLQAGGYGEKIIAVGDDIVPEIPTQLTMSSKEDIFTYSGRDYYLLTKNVFALDSRYLFLNMGAALVAGIIARPRKVVSVTPLANPEQVEQPDKYNLDSITIADGNLIPAEPMNINNTTYATSDIFNE